MGKLEKWALRQHNIIVDVDSEYVYIHLHICSAFINYHLFMTKKYLPCLVGIREVFSSHDIQVTKSVFGCDAGIYLSVSKTVVLFSCYWF